MACLHALEARDFIPELTFEDMVDLVERAVEGRLDRDRPGREAAVAARSRRGKDMVSEAVEGVGLVGVVGVIRL